MPKQLGGGSNQTTQAGCTQNGRVGCAENMRMRTSPLHLVLAAVGLVVLCMGRAWALPAETWVVSIGNNRGAAEDVQLLYAERDAREIAEVLRSQGSVVSDHVRLLLDENADTTRRTLLSLNAALRAKGEGPERPTALIVFYSGHADADALHMRGSRFSFEELRALVAGSPATMRILVVDACRSGSVTRVKGVKAAPEFAIQMEDRVEAEGTAIISSSTAGESSQESDRLRGSFFSHHLMNALRGAADRNGDGRVTLSEAYAYTYGQTLRSSGQTLSLQHPTYAYDVKGSGDLVLTTQAEGGDGRTRLRLDAAATYLIAEERESGAVVAELVTNRPQAILTLPPGRYFVQQRGQTEYREFQVTLAQGSEVDLAQQRYRLVHYDRLVRKRGGIRRSVHGISVVAGARGETVPGRGVAPNLALGYSADLPWLTVGARVRGSIGSIQAADQGLTWRHDELGLGFLLSRYIDLPWFSVAFGVAIDGVLTSQRFVETPRIVSTRTSLGLGVEALFVFERRLFQGLSLRVEGGPAALLSQRAIVESGVETGTHAAAALTWGLGGGLIWRF